MEEHISSTESAHTEPSSHELVILHTADAHEWASYLQEILQASKKFCKRSILLYTVSPADQLHGYNFEYFQSCKCIVLLITGALLDMLCDAELHGALESLLYPPHRVVALLCGVSEDDMLTENFGEWLSWRKLSAEDHPSVYISTILDSVTDSWRAEAEQTSLGAAAAELQNVAASSTSTENPTTDEKEEAGSLEQKETVLEEEAVGTGNSAREEISAPTQLTCVTVQPSRVLCGECPTLFIILAHKVDDQSVPEVEFSFENVAAKRVPVTLENEYTLSVTAPDMPAGVVSLTMYTDQSRVSLKPVTYYTSMGEVSRYLENATDPVNFIYQAFDLTSDATESLDNMLSDSLKSRMPATSLQLFGIRQIEEDNMAAYQRDEEFPTLLHFAAKYGLKKLTAILLRCPGALQAYSVMNKHGDYPNNLAEKSGFYDLRQFMDEFVETADMVKSHFVGSINTEENAEVYEPMATSSQDIMMKYSGCSEDIYESMLEIDPECGHDLYEAMSAVDENPEETMLRKFFQVKPHASVKQDVGLTSQEAENDAHNHVSEVEEEEDPYNLFPEDIYDTVDTDGAFNTAVLNRPPAPVPRPESLSEPEQPMIYRVFSEKGPSDESAATDVGYSAAEPEEQPSSPVYDPYGGMKTPGQRQLISLQERVKVGEITVDEAVQEFKAWQFDHERRASSIRYQQENLKRLRESITRRHKEKQKSGKELDYEISAPLQRNLYWGSNVPLECSVYEATPRVVAQPPPAVAQTIQRGTWKTGSTSSTSSTESNRLSTHSTFSYSSGTEPDFEDISEILPPPRPPRSSEAAAHVSSPRMPPPRIPPPRIPPRVPERMAEQERYISCPTRALPQRPTQRHAAPPISRRPL